MSAFISCPKQLWGPFPTSLPRKARDSFENVFIQNVYETACKEAWSIATPLIAPDYSGHTGIFWQESVLLLAMFRNRRWLFSDLPISVRKSTNIALHPVPAERRNKTLECWLNVSSAIMSHALEFGTNKSLEQVGIDISAPCTRESKNKFGSKCESFAADMSSRMSAPGIPCSKKTVLRIGFMMDHHRDYWARCNMCLPQNEAGWFASASWIDVLLHVFLDIDIGLYKLGLRLKALESSQHCEGRAANSAKRK